MDSITPKVAGEFLTQNRNRLFVQAEVTRVTATAERNSALILIDRQKPEHCITLGAGKVFDAAGFVTELRKRNVTPHVAFNGAVSTLSKARSAQIDARTTRHEGYAISQAIRKRIEEALAGSRQ